MSMSPEGTPDGDKQAAYHQAGQPLQPPPTVHPEGIQDGNELDTGTR